MQEAAGIKTRYNLPSLSFLSSPSSTCSAPSKRIESNISSPRDLPMTFSYLDRAYRIIFQCICEYICKTLENCDTIFRSCVKASDGWGKMFTLQSVIRFFPCRISIRISFTARIRGIDRWKEMRSIARDERTSRVEVRYKAALRVCTH